MNYESPKSDLALNSRGGISQRIRERVGYLLVLMSLPMYYLMLKDLYNFPDPPVAAYGLFVVYCGYLLLMIYGVFKNKRYVKWLSLIVVIPFALYILSWVYLAFRDRSVSILLVYLTTKDTAKLVYLFIWSSIAAYIVDGKKR